MMVTNVLNALMHRVLCRETPWAQPGTGCISLSFLEGWVFDISGGRFGESCSGCQTPLSLGPVFSVFPERQAAASAWCLLSSLHRNYSCPWMQLAQTTGELTNASPLPRLPVALNPWWMGTDLKCPDLSPLSRLTQRHTVSQNFHQD